MPNHHTFVGHKIKGIRESKNLSIEEVAERSGLSLEQITSIETDQNLPSLGPLIKIARALGVRLGTFMDDNDELGPVITRASEREQNSSISFSNGANDARKRLCCPSGRCARGCVIGACGLGAVAFPADVVLAVVGLCVSR